MRFLPVARVALIILLSWVTAANGQQPAEVPRVRQIGVLSISLSADSEEAAASRRGLQEAGHVEGRDLSISWWSGRGSYDKVADAAAALVRRNGGMTLAANPAAADSPTMPRIGVLLPQILASPAEVGLREGLREHGYVESQNIVIEWRRIGNSIEDATPHAIELVHSKPDLILALATSSARAVMRATHTIPIVFLSRDPVATGLAESLARPGANATGVSTASPQLTAKRLELVHQLVPRARRVAFLSNPSNSVLPAQFAEAQKAAAEFGLHLRTLDARNSADLDAVLRGLQRSAPEAILVASDLGLLTEKAKIASAIRKARIPAIFPWKEYHEHGALMSYGPDFKDTLRRTASYVARILKGASPGGLPIEEISKFDLIIDLRVARELKLDVPQSLLLRANEVIQ